MAERISYEDALTGYYREVSSTYPLPTSPIPYPWLIKRATADVQAKAGAGKVHTVTISGTQATPVAGLLTIYDSLTETGTVLYSEWVPAGVLPHTVILDVPAATGIYIGYDATLVGVAAVVSYV